MAVSKAEMMTLALRYLGITNVSIPDPGDTDNPFAVTFSDWWRSFIPKELELFDWRFARTSETLNLSVDFTDSPYQNMPYVYQWPPYCLIPRFMPGVSAEDHVPFDIGVQGNPGHRKRLIYTARLEASLIYSCDMSLDYGLFPYSFGVMIAGRLALEWGARKSGAGKQFDGLKTLYAALVGEARNVDAQMTVEDTLYNKFTPRYVAARGDSVAPSGLQNFEQSD